MSIEHSTVERFADAFSDVYAIMNERKSLFSQDARPSEKKLLAETAIFLVRFTRESTISPEDKGFLEDWIQEICGTLGMILYKDHNAFLAAFRYFHDNFSKNMYSAHAVTESVILSIRAIEGAGIEVNWEASVITKCLYHFQRLLTPLLSLVRAFKENVGLFFLLLNIIDMFGTISDKEKFGDLFKSSKHIAESLKTEFTEAYLESPGLRVFAADMIEKYSLRIPSPPELDSPVTPFLLLHKLSRGEKISVSSKDSSMPHLHWIVEAWSRSQEGETDLGILPYFGPRDVRGIANLVWQDISTLASISAPSKDELEPLMKLDDPGIKQYLYKYFYSHPKITPESKLQLEAERDKEHGGGEISDFNVEFQTPGKRVMVCIPIKSPRETKSTKVSRLVLNNVHQIVGPALKIGKERVYIFPLILGEKTLDTTEFLTMNRLEGLIPMEVYDINFFYRLLKREGYI